MSLRISVIIPVYNTERYLHRCLDSIINQTYKNLEIICINDGSSDNSLDILREYEKNDTRITVITQKNSGLSAARNLGMAYSTGDFISFVDSDDSLVLTCYETCIRYASEDVDVIAFTCTKIFPPKKASAPDATF